ncbi:S41 family peptidase [Massilia sp. YIM B02443]|uniref:S41 family peptidase n=1 Tax=Massilia sp. YIM B02443 TaxID=3050127 RepID=UPI0025B6BDA6|nr:S41 family peptidase [Massilia sp. YIM B02443]MDN4038062.1 S41 family peptidase [Massilia sp. YIM B02443]
MGSTFKNSCLIGLGAIAGVGLTMQFSALALKPPVEASMPMAELRQLADAYGVIKSDYVEPIEDKHLLSQAIAGMVESLDPHSAYLDPRAYRELREGTEGRFVGLGIEIVESEEGYIEIVAPMEDSPAEQAGIKAGDLITRIDDFAVQGVPLDDAIKRMRGEPGTRVTLTIARKDAPAPLRLTVERREIVQKSVKARMVEPGYGWLRISQFQEPTVDDMAARLQALYREDPDMKGLVLDLRNDPGGLLQGAIGVAAAFLPKNAEIVSTNGQLEEQRQRFYGRPEFYMLRSGADPLAALPPAFKTLPMVVLVNTGSASASEIVAGALQDYKRAAILGSQTFGKGSVQTIRPIGRDAAVKLTTAKRAAILGSQTFGKGSVQTIRPIGRDAAVKLTTARYYTPAGRSIQARGIVPDFPVDETADGDGLNALRMREADLQHHLSNEKAQEIATREDEIEEQMRLLAASPAASRLRKPLDYGGSDDFQLAQALRHLKGQQVALSPRAGGATLARHAR